jgi:oxygen-independent coproporphyrinogen-3 oxidase
VKLSQGRVKLDPEREVEMYERTWEWLGQAGYAQYEISNFARAGHACLHNLNTWRMQEWIGWGPSAASQYQGWRGRNVADLKRWREDLAKGERAAEDRTQLTSALLLEDSMIFGLRMNEGVNVEAAARRFRGEIGGGPPPPLLRKLHEFEGDGVIRWEGPVAKLTPKGRLLADRVGSELML